MMCVRAAAESLMVWMCKEEKDRAIKQRAEPENPICTELYLQTVVNKSLNCLRSQSKWLIPELLNQWNVMNQLRGEKPNILQNWWIYFLVPETRSVLIKNI